MVLYDIFNETSVDINSFTANELLQFMQQNKDVGQSREANQFGWKDQQHFIKFCNLILDEFKPTHVSERCKVLLFCVTEIPSNKEFFLKIVKDTNFESVIEVAQKRLNEIYKQEFLGRFTKDGSKPNPK